MIQNIIQTFNSIFSLAALVLVLCLCRLSDLNKKLTNKY